MSEINKIKLNEVEYDIEDTTARENIVNMQTNVANDLDACSLVAEEDKTLAGAYAVQQLNRSLGGVTQFVVDETTGKITGYKTEVGADTVFPFSGGEILYSGILSSTKNTSSGDTDENTNVFDVINYSKLTITYSVICPYGSTTNKFKIVGDNTELLSVAKGATDTLELDISNYSAIKLYNTWISGEYNLTTNVECRFYN